VRDLGLRLRCVRGHVHSCYMSVKIIQVDLSVYVARVVVDEETYFDSPQFYALHQARSYARRFARKVEELLRAEE
jgi:hypothetical protein